MPHPPCQPSLRRLSRLPSVLRVSQPTAQTHAEFLGAGGRDTVKGCLAAPLVAFSVSLSCFMAAQSQV